MTYLKEFMGSTAGQGVNSCYANPISVAMHAKDFLLNKKRMNVPSALRIRLLLKAERTFVSTLP
jgi:hypothetical protein